MAGEHNVFCGDITLDADYVLALLAYHQARERLQEAMTASRHDPTRTCLAEERALIAAADAAEAAYSALTLSREAGEPPRPRRWFRSRRR